jgi:hypothetical protein
MTVATRQSERLVLLVEPDADDRERHGAWLEAAGYGVINCPGPAEAGMVCLGQRGRTCGLVEIADVLVLDLGLVRDAVGKRTPGRRLLHYYLSSGKPVMLLARPRQGGQRYRDDGVAVLQRSDRVSRKRFLETLHGVEVQT